jgi:hypothetical protein
MRAIGLGGLVAVVLSAPLAAALPVGALPPPGDRADYGAAGTARNGYGGEIAPSATSASWPGTGLGANGGPFAFVGAQYGSLWGLPPGPNNSLGVGYCVMEDVSGTGRVSRQSDPAEWDAGEMARAAALMATFGGDRVVPYGIDVSGSYDVATGEWHHPALGAAGTITRRRQVAVNFGVRMFLEDVSPSGVAAGRKLARDTSVVNGSRGDFNALRNGYVVAQRLADVAERQHAVGGVRLSMLWATPSGEPPTDSGTYPVEVHVVDGSGKPVGFVPVLQLSATGLDGNRSRNAVARVDDRRDNADDRARSNAARATGWPDWGMDYRHVDDQRFAVSERADAADVADASGVARFRVEITDSEWELAFHALAPTADVELHAGTGLQGQVTWAGRPQPASVHQVHRPGPPPEEPDRYIAVAKTATDLQVPVAGTEFALSDGSGVEIGRSVVGDDGRAVFPGFSPTRFEPPYVLRERLAAPGLRPLDGEIAVPPPDELSTDPDHPTVIEVVNDVIVATIGTSAADAADGDRYVDLGVGATGAIVDSVTYCGLVPGIEYVASGEIHTVDADGSPTSTGVTGTAAFTPDDACGTVDVRLDIGPADETGVDLRGAVGVVFQRLSIAATGRLVAEHADPSDPAQTIYFPAISTTLQRAETATAGGSPDQQLEVGEPAADVVSYAGLAPGTMYRAELTLHERTADGICRSTGVWTSTIFTPERSSGAYVVGDLVPPGPGVFVAMQQVMANDQDEVPVVAHDDCDDPHQTVYVSVPLSPPSTTPDTTSVPATSPTSAAAPTTAAPRSPPTGAPATSPSRTIPRTGTDLTGRAVDVASLLLAAGLVTLAVGRSRRETASETSSPA